MDERYYLILEFLLDKTEPVKAKDFPIQITHLFTPGLGKESLEYALMILDAKKLIAGANRHKYSITPDGILIVNDYNTKKKSQVPDLRERLDNNPIAQPSTEQETHNKAILKKGIANRIFSNPWVITIVGGLVLAALAKLFGLI